jgi:hypothetical protein
MAVIAGMVGKRFLLELGIGCMQREEVFLILLDQTRGKTSGRFPLVVYIGFAKSWEMVVCGLLLGSSCIVGCFPAPAAGFLRASEVVRLKMILPFSLDLQDAS